MNNHTPPPDARLSSRLGGQTAASWWQRLRRGSWLIEAAGDWPRFAGDDWLSRIMEMTVTDRLHEKQGRSIGRVILRDGADALSFYLKRHFRLPLWRGLLATIFPECAWSPGLREWRNLVWAAAAGFPVPRPVTAGQLVGPWFRLQGFLAVEELRGMLPLHEAVPLAAERLDSPTFARWKRGLIAELARLARELHSRKVFHKDLYFCHFYIPESFTRDHPPDWNNRVVMIDLHRLAKHRIAGAWWQAKDLAQLLYSSDVAGVTARDRVRFWKLYCSGWPARPPRRWILPLVRWKWRFYQRHERRQGSM